MRKSVFHLTTTERDNFLRAVLLLKNAMVSPTISRYDQFIAIHRYILNVNPPGPADNIDYGHGNAAFTAWHRYFILKFEQALQEVSGDPTVMLPYWDWTNHDGTRDILFQDDFLGPNGTSANGYDVMSGYFAYDAPGTGANPTPAPAWWPLGLAGWRIPTSLGAGLGTTLARRFGGGGVVPADVFSNLTTESNVNFVLTRTSYPTFRGTLENGTRLHGYIHLWIGGGSSGPGHMRSVAAAPSDPIFFMHHCNVDRLWAMWQKDGHEGAAFYGEPFSPEGHNLGDLMYPWVGAVAGYSSNNPIVGFPFPDFSGEAGKTPADMLDHRALGYAYDTEPVVGLALDQTGSMAGMTPDPMTGMPPNVTKWEAAKQGVSFFFQDCEVAYDAREAYVTGGVETFRSLAGVNTFTKIFPGAPSYGLIKNGTDHSRATFEAEIAGETPDGGTPIAGALTDANTDIVRAPYGDNPAGEQRYLCMLTDGIETSPPWLGSLLEPQFPDTVIFAMGFGMGGGWDGVNYGALEDITQKGKSAPLGTAQVFHGENAAEIDKFYTNSLASAIGYVPATDPVFELFPGEHIMVPFDATDADQSFMITALGFDFNDKNWDFCIMNPQGVMCHQSYGDDSHSDAHEHGSHTGEGRRVRITTKKKDGRITAFINRNGVASSEWVGAWNLVAFYKVDMKEGMGRMLMYELGSLLYPSGAPPVRGALYTRYTQEASERPTMRFSHGVEPHELASMLPGIAGKHKGNPCALAVNIYTKTTVHVDIRADLTAPYAGHDFMLSATVHSLGGGVSVQNIRARLIAPGHSLGNAFADLKTIPLDRRGQYLTGKKHEEPFDALAYLADYERKRPGAFPIRDELLSFTQHADGAWRTRVSRTAFPGAYRAAVYVEGLYYPKARAGDCCEREPERFTRIISANIMLGIHPDPVKSAPTMHWIGPNKIAVSVTPTDALGNVIMPTSASSPVLSLNGVEIAGTFINDYSGTLRMEVTLQGRGIQASANGRTIIGGPVLFPTAGGKELTLKSGQELRMEISVGGSAFRAQFPVVIGNKS